MPIDFIIPKLSDKEIVEKMLDAFNQFEYLGRIDIKVRFTSSINSEMYNTVSLRNFEDDIKINEVLKLNNQCFYQIKFELDSETSFRITRDNTTLISDNATLEYNNQPNKSTQNAMYQLDQLLAVAKQKLGSFNPNLLSSSVMSEDLQKYYSQREETQSLLQRITADLVNDTASYRNTIDTQFEKKQLDIQIKCDNLQNKLENDYRNLKTELEQKYQEMSRGREKELNDKIGEYEKKKAEFDDRDNTHVRRELRNELKGIIKGRATNFNLTESTIKKRGIVHSTSILTMIFFAGLTIWGFIEMSINPNGTTDIPIVIRSVFSSLAFGATMIFFLKWNNQWFQQHANEEFRLKRMELDIDRASWVVEMAMEWKTEKGTEIPEELLQRLTANLFAEDKMYYDNLHPADNFATALLGASSNIKFNTPNAQFEVDRKGAERLRKDLSK